MRHYLLTNQRSRYRKLSTRVFEKKITCLWLVKKVRWRKCVATSGSPAQITDPRYYRGPLLFYESVLFRWTVTHILRQMEISIVISKASEKCRRARKNARPKRRIFKRRSWKWGKGKRPRPTPPTPRPPCETSRWRRNSPTSISTRKGQFVVT